MSEWVRVIADDLTGACDVAAALVATPEGIVVEGPSQWGGSGGVGVVRNTQSRTLAPELAAARVREALTDVPSRWRGLLLKKIDTGLRGPLGAELDAAMDAVGAGVAVVLAAIPEAGRSTVGGRQLVDGVPVHETPFARDPDNPVTDARIGAVIEATSRRRTANVGMDEVARVGAAAAVARRCDEGATVIVGDAVTDRDLAAWVSGLEVRRPPSVRVTRWQDAIVLAGSTGLARQLRGCVRCDDPVPPPPRGAATHGVLVVAGSAHPVTSAQLAHAERLHRLGVVPADPEDAVASGAEAARRLERGDHTVLTPPAGRREGGAVRGALALAAATALERTRPRGLVLVGGETAFDVLAAIGDPRLAVMGSPAPLAVRAILLDGRLAGTPVVTKGGSSGPSERLAELVEELLR